MSGAQDWIAIRGQLAAPMPFEVLPKAVRSRSNVRPGESAFVAQALGYIDRSDVMGRLDVVVGLNGWRDEYSVLDLDKKIVECRIGLRIDGEWVYRADVGGPGDIPAERDAWKAAYSDSLKRAATHWGVGRFIYDLGKAWLPCKAEIRQGAKRPSFVSWECEPMDLLLAQARRNGVTWAQDFRLKAASATTAPAVAPALPTSVAPPAAPSAVAPAPAPSPGASNTLGTLEELIGERRITRRQVSAYCKLTFGCERPSQLSAEMYERLLAHIREGKIAAQAA